MQAADDIHLIREVLQGRQSAYATLVDRYQVYVFTLVMRFVNNREIAEELSQDVFVKAYRFLADFKGNSKFSTWLYTIVNTTCISYLRSRKDDLLLMEEEQITILQDKQTSQLPNIIAEQKGDAQMINSGMNLLPPEDARILYLFYNAEQSVEEIGVIMGMSANNVKVRLFRARQKLKEILQQKFSRELAGR